VKFRVVENFWERFYDLRPEQKASVRRAWTIFKVDPFDRRLRAHKIHKLSAEYGATIYSAVIEADLRIVFRIDGDTITTLDIGTHAIYK
jgi:mRNA-degrading endonuclease YafQ of YafQ-DinJ toxin-antitoxin module